jgi:GTP cyclohydrolase I
MHDNPTDHLNCVRELLTMHAGLEETEHGEDTPMRFLNMLSELTSHRDCDGSCVKWRDFKADSDEMIVVAGIPFTSVCNHHVIPFIGQVHIGYVPNQVNAGLSKFARVARHFAQRLQVQERLTADIAEYLYDKLDPRGVAVVIQAEHMCMTIRGVQAPGTVTTTSSMRGVYSDHSRTAKLEFMNIIKRSLK